MAKSTVALVSCKEYGEETKRAVKKSVDYIGGMERIVGRGDVVLIKPNLVNARDGESGNITHFSLVEALIEICYDSGAGEIIVGDGSGNVDTPEAFMSSGMKGAVDKLSSKGIPVKFVDLNYDKNPETGEYDAINLEEQALNSNQIYRVAHKMLVADAVISVPKLKSHSRTGITVALKNVIGIAPGGYYGFPKWKGKVEILPHGPLDEGPVSPKSGSAVNSVIWQTIIDLYRVFLGTYPNSSKKRKHLAVVDGVVAGAYNNRSGELPLWDPVKSGAIIAGVDPVAVDTVSAKVMCYRPELIPLVANAASLGVGRMNDIEILGEKIDDLRKFVPPAFNWLDVVDTDIRGMSLKKQRQIVKKKMFETAVSLLRGLRLRA